MQLEVRLVLIHSIASREEVLLETDVLWKPQCKTIVLLCVLIKYLINGYCDNLFKLSLLDFLLGQSRRLLDLRYLHIH
jgi:hypothetical protein